MSINERVKIWFEKFAERGENQKKIAKELGRSTQYVNQLATGKGPFGYSAIKLILDYDKALDARWLIFGEGNMYPANIKTAEKNKSLIKDNSNDYVMSESKMVDIINEIVQTKNKVIELQDEVCRLKTTLQKNGIDESEIE